MMRKGEAGIVVIIVVGLLFTLFAQVFYGDVGSENKDTNTTERVSE